MSFRLLSTEQVANSAGIPMQPMQKRFRRMLTVDFPFIPLSTTTQQESPQ